ncbi:hypothetical protein, partial [Streptosporangium sp. NPDC048865]|uniref:hypothetical protein n=1 Tax=Streptosporangium sp. NPDC048865 TaxID=3155766 RepID=UPI00343D48C0
LLNIDEVIQVIRSSDDSAQARARLTEIFELSAVTLVTTAMTTAAATAAGPPARGAYPLPDLVLTTVHDGPFEAGGLGTFSIDVTAAPGSAGITRPTAVTYHFPPGLTPVSASGTGWGCRITAGIVGCGTRDLAAPGFQLPRITVGVTVSRDASGTLTASGRAVHTAREGVEVIGSGAEAGPAPATVASTVQVVPAPPRTG